MKNSARTLTPLKVRQCDTGAFVAFTRGGSHVFERLQIALQDLPLREWGSTPSLHKEPVGKIHAMVKRVKKEKKKGGKVHTK